MFDFLGNIFSDLHPIFVHFPIALLLVSFGMTIVARWRPALHETSWLLLVLGGLSTLPATVTGLIAHQPYEETPSMAYIESHEVLGILGTLLTIGVLVWRWRTRRNGSDAGQTRLYAGVAIVGMVWLFLLGGTGGNLVYEYGINVRGINPLLPVSQSAESSAPIQQLLASFDGELQVNGEPLVLFGQVVDVNGNAVPNAVIEIWQTDTNGSYDHPADPATEERDRSFQFFGATTTDADGWYAFRTILPGPYQPRPRHIHYKIKLEGAQVLVSQFYFSRETVAVNSAEEAAIIVGGDSRLQLAQLADLLLANGRVVIDTGIGRGVLPLTSPDAEGPYYPVVPVADYDNDLTSLP